MSEENQESASDAAEDTNTIRVILKDRKARPFFGRHPWVFESAIAAVETPDGNEPPPGSVAELWSAKNEFIAHGLWNSHSNIKLRLYSWDSSVHFDESLIAERIRKAVDLRRQAFDLTSPTAGCRLVFSEGDDLSGLTVDLYADYLLVQFTSLALYQYREAIIATLQAEVRPSGIWLRTEKGMREAEHLEAVDGLVSGSEPPRPLFVEEHGVKYGVDVQQGQKTGCYLDQRDNRQAAATFIHGKTLDAFCFAGGFGITAALKNGKTNVLGIDSSDAALAIARANAELNEVADQCRYERADVKAKLEEFANEGKEFDSIILDPPRMARSRGGITRALKGYSRLNLAAINVLKPGGILVTCSCSGLVSRDAFREMIAGVARTSRRPIQILEQHGQPSDHPISATCPETEYLKMLICRVL